MKVIKRIICSFLAISLMLSGFLYESNKTYAEDTKQDNDFYYVSLGASNTNGFGLHGYFEESWYSNPALGIYTPGLGVSGYRKVTDGAYPQLIKGYIESLGYNVTLNQLAQSSMRPEELRFLLDDNYTQDEYTKWRFYDTQKQSTWWYNDLASLREDYRKSIAEADLITYDLGASNFAVYLINRLTSGNYTNDPKYLDDDYKKLFNSYVSGIKSKLVYRFLKDYISDDIINTLAYAYAGFCNNFDKSMEKIYELNPDANVVVVGIQNMAKDLKVKVGGATIDVEDLYGELIDDANKYINNSPKTLLNRNKSKYYTKYKYTSLSKSRAEFFIDDVIAYDGNPASLSTPLKEAIDCLDTSADIMLKFRVAALICQANNWHPEYLSNFRAHMADFVNICETNCPDLYETTLTRAYDAVFTLFSKACKNSPLVVDALISGDMDEIEEKSITDLYNLIQTVVARSLEESAEINAYLTDSELNEIIASILNDSGEAFCIAYSVRGAICNSFFTHPNANGHKEIANIIESTIKNNNIVTKYAPKLLSIDIECPQLVYPKKSTSLCKEFKVVAKYSDNSTKDLTNQCTITIPDMSTNGRKSVNVKYGDSYNKSFNIYVFGTKSVSLNLEGRIIINYYTEYPSYLSENYKPGVLFFKQNNEPTLAQIKEAYNNNEGIETFEVDNDYLIFQYDELAAKEMSDDVYIVLYAKQKDIDPVFGSPQKYKITQYTNTVLGSTSETKLQTLIVDMLNYGASAQTYFNHNLSNLPNKDLTSKQKGYGTKTIPSIKSRTKAYVDPLSSGNVSIKSASMILGNELSINYYAAVNSEKTIKNIELLAFDDYSSGNTYDENTAIARYNMEYVESKGQYLGSFPNIVAKDMRKMLYGRVHVTYTDNTSEYSSIRSYSVEDYAYTIINNASATKNMKDLVKTMICYGDSAAEYLKNKGAQ